MMVNVKQIKYKCLCLCIYATSSYRRGGARKYDKELRYSWICVNDVFFAERKKNPRSLNNIIIYV